MCEKGFCFLCTGFPVTLKAEQNSNVNCQYSLCALKCVRPHEKLVHLSFNQKFPSINKTKALAVLLLLFSLFYSVPVWSKETMSERLVSHIKTSSDRDNAALPPSPNTHTHTHVPASLQKEHIWALLWSVKQREKSFKVGVCLMCYLSMRDRVVSFIFPSFSGTSSFIFSPIKTNSLHECDHLPFRSDQWPFL